MKVKFYALLELESVRGLSTSALKSTSRKSDPSSAFNYTVSAVYFRPALVFLSTTISRIYLFFDNLLFERLNVSLYVFH